MSRPASTMQGGSCLAFPDVCKDASGVPVPFANVALCADADPDTCAQKVRIRNKRVLHRATEIPRTAGDEPGVGLGVVSGTVMDQAVYRSSHANVRVEGNEIVTQLDLTAHNGTNANAPLGLQQTASQDIVVVGDGT